MGGKGEKGLTCYEVPYKQLLQEQLNIINLNHMTVLFSRFPFPSYLHLALLNHFPFLLPFSVTLKKKKKRRR